MFLKLIEQVIVEDRNTLMNRTVYFSGEFDCVKITSTECLNISTLKSDHEEADTKLVAFVKSYKIDNNEKVMVRSPSGDIDILILFVQHCSGTNVLIDTGHGNSRHIIDISLRFLSETQYHALSGLHAFSGNDYVSSFFGKGKSMFWKTLMKNEEFMKTFASLGGSANVSNDTKQQLERFVCVLYGLKKLVLVDEVRKCMFLQKSQNSRSSLDLSTFPPCHLVDQTMLQCCLNERSISL